MTEPVWMRVRARCIQAGLDDIERDCGGERICHAAQPRRPPASACTSRPPPSPRSCRQRRRKNLYAFRICRDDDPVRDILPDTKGPKFVHDPAFWPHILNNRIRSGIKSFRDKDHGEAVNDRCPVFRIVEQFCQTGPVIGRARPDQLADVFPVLCPVQYFGILAGEQVPTE